MPSVNSRSSLSSSFSSQLPLAVKDASDAKKVDLYKGLLSEKAGSASGCVIPERAGITSPSILDFDINLHSSATIEFAVILFAEPETAKEISCQILPLANHITLSHVLGCKIGFGTQRGGLPHPKCSPSRKPKKRSIAAIVPGTVLV